MTIQGVASLSSNGAANQSYLERQNQFINNLSWTTGRHALKVGADLSTVHIEQSDRLALTYVGKADYEATGSSEHLTEGIIDNVRALEGTLVAGVIRDKPDGGRAARKVSLRSSDGSVDVSVIAREQGGGGHKRAAGFGTDMPYPEIVEFVRAEVAKQLD